MHDRHHAHAHHTPGDDGPTLLFQRNLPGHGERCTLCPFNKPPVGHPSPPILPLPTTQPPPRRHHATLVAPANTAPLPRPALLAGDLRGSGTLVLPDALRSAGPDAATIEQPQSPHPLQFDELASPDITVLQPALAPPTSPPHPHRARRPTRVVSTRAYLALNLCLGLLIVAGLVLLAVRDLPSAAPGVSASE